LEVGPYTHEVKKCGEFLSTADSLRILCIGQDWSKARSQYVEQTKDADNGKTMTAVTKMVESLGDKYTRVLHKEQYAALQKFDLIGVGVALMQNAQKDIIVRNPPIEGPALDKAGLKTGDLVTAINWIATKGRTAFDIVNQISKNPNACTVTFFIQQQDDNDLPGEGPKFDAMMGQQNFLQVKDPVQYKLSEKRKDGTNVGYVCVSEFNSLVNTKLQDALDDLKCQGANAYVLDLRMNPEGAFQSAVEISAFFYEDRVATYVVNCNTAQ
jgi:carboxyl-terminal processing protease